MDLLPGMYILVNTAHIYEHESTVAVTKAKE